MRLKELEKRLKQEPNNLGLRVTVAGLLRETGRSVEAVELYRSVALAYRDQGRHQQAIAVCRSILEIAPDDVACQALIGMLTTPRGPEVRELTPAPAAAPASAPRRSSLEQTPLPRPVPYHIADPTSGAARASRHELELPMAEGADTRPGGEERPEGDAASGLAQAARRISGLIAGSDARAAEDLAAELDTRQRPRIDAEQLHKISLPPPTVPVPQVELDDDLPTPPPPRDTPVDLSAQHGRPTPNAHDADDELTQPRDRLPTKDEE